MAWLHSAPKTHPKDEDPQIRMNAMDKDDPARDLPEINPFMAMCFQSIGMFLSGGMSITAITWLELDSFVNRSGYILNGFESEQLINMSRNYCNFYHKAKELSCPAPYNSATTNEDAMEKVRSIVNDKFRSMIRKDRK